MAKRLFGEGLVVLQPACSLGYDFYRTWCFLRTWPLSGGMRDSVLLPEGRSALAKPSFCVVTPCPSPGVRSGVEGVAVVRSRWRVVLVPSFPYPEYRAITNAARSRAIA